ncbi:MAG: hypothetical protein SGBAC_003590 [Bacillariaceae sp.]
MPLARRFSNSSVGSNVSRRLSLPSSIHGSTKVNPSKVDKLKKSEMRKKVITRRQTREQTRKKNESQDKENQNLNIDTQEKENQSVKFKEQDKENESLLVPPSPTPYWKVAKERGNRSPRETRSAKKKRLSVSRFNFSPPKDSDGERDPRVVLKFDNEASLNTKKETIDLPVETSRVITTPQDMEVDLEARSHVSSFEATTSGERNTDRIADEVSSLTEVIQKLVEQNNQQPAISQEQVLVEEKEAWKSKAKEMEYKYSSERDQLMSNNSCLTAELEATKQEAEIKIRTLEETKRNLERQRDALQNDKLSLHENLSKLQIEINTERENLADSKVRLEALMAEIDAEKTTLKDDQESFHQVNFELTKELERVKENYDSLVGRTTDYEEHIRMLEEDLLPESEKQIEDSLATVAQLEEAATEARHKMLQYEKEIKDLKETVNVMGEQNEEERRNFQDLNEKSVEAFENLQKDLCDKKAVIEELEVKLASAGEDLAYETEKVNNMCETLQNLKLDMDKRNQALQNSLDKSMEALDKALEEKKQLQEKLAKAEEKIDENRTFMDELVSTGKMKSASLEESDKARMVMQHKIAELESKLQKTTHERDSAKARMATFDEREEALFQKLRASDQVRRDLHNRVMQLSGNIRVYVRVRPALQSESERPKENNSEKRASTRGQKRKFQAGDDESPFHFPGQLAGLNERMAKKSQTFGSDDPTKNIVEVTEPYKDRGGLSARQKKWTFGFDHIFDPSHGQEDVWNATEPLVQSAIDGFNVCVFAYGQTGSGKTFTMLGEKGNEGIVSRAVNMLLRARSDMVNLSRGEKKVELAVELLEVYNEKVRDLLVPNSGPDGQELTLKISGSQAVGSKIVPVNSEEEIHSILERAQKRRCVKATSSNAVSSRSHMIFTIFFKVQTKEGAQRVGKLHVCDLAGSERLGKSNANERVGSSLLRETKHINTSLSVLSNVIEKLQAGDKNVPYRESKLTHLLQNSLGGNSKTLAIVCCNPLQSHFHESLCSLRFAAKVNKVDLKAVTNFNA